MSFDWKLALQRWVAGAVGGATGISVIVQPLTTIQGFGFLASAKAQEVIAVLGAVIGFSAAAGVDLHAWWLSRKK